MTSISPAQPRSPPSISLSPVLRQSQHKSLSHLKVQPKEEQHGHAQDNVVVTLVDGRPTKRRKTSLGSVHAEGDGPPPQSAPEPIKYVGVPWPTVVRELAGKAAESPSETALPPLPSRPWGTVATKESSLPGNRLSVRIRKKVAVPTTPDCIQGPSDAPVFEKGKHADYFPWTGKHPEDVLNENNVRSGYCDRPLPQPEKEVNNAKAPLYNAFKHRAGLDSLSALFGMVLDSKNKHGAFSSHSTFKGPPPRVTLTEAKRKSWMADLANPDVPLRRLSKTIPQGIRGTALLEQCLQHNIPLSRAIWFTKCVGANEIRTLKRKGVTPAGAQSAEAKWLKEWTTNVEQLLEGILTQCGQNKWKERIRYCIVLCARLYFENLLDRDHYLEWITKSLSTANTNHWPFWLMIVHIHRLDLTAFRRKGRQLAEALVVKYNAVQNSAGEALQPLAQSFAAVLRPFVLAKPECFLMPDRWTECQQALKSCLDEENDTHQQALEKLRRVNERAMGKVSHGSGTAASPGEQVFEVLDSTRAPFAMPAIYESLNHACNDLELLMSKCLEWCVSRFRTAKSRIYLCARLFRKWHKQGHNVDNVLLDFIFNRANCTVVDEATLKHFVSELSRSQTFPLSKYMQWLSVRGLPVADSFRTDPISPELERNVGTIRVQKSSGVTQVLTDVCLWNMEDHLVNLRQSLLRHAGFDESVESTGFEKLKVAVSDALTRSEQADVASVCNHIHFKILPWSFRTQLSYWLRGEVASLAKASQLEIPGKPPLPGMRGLTLKRFQIIRNILEKVEDFAILADVIRVTSTSRQEEILAAAVDTINLHASIFSAIGALEPLQTLFGQTYLALRSIKTTMPSYANSLIDLCQQFPIKYTPVRALQQDLIKGDRGRAVTACSPFSDGVAESLQQAGATFSENFDAILQTETNMSEQTMLRLFKLLVERIEKLQHSEDDTNQYFVLCQLLARLKLCQRAQGEALAKKWVARLCSGNGQSMNLALLVCLVCTHCVTLESVMDSCQQLPPNAPLRRRFYDYLRTGLVDKRADEIDEFMWYGFKIALSKLAVLKPVELLDVIGSDESGRSLDSAVKSSLIATIVSSPDMMKSLSKPAWLVLSQTLTEYLSAINTSDAPEVQAKALADIASPLSLPFCSLRMRMLCQNAATKNDENIQDEIAAQLCATVANTESSLAGYPRTFQALLRATGPVISAKVRSCVEQAFYQALPKFLQSKGLVQPPTPTTAEVEQTACALQQVVLVSTDATASPQANVNAGLIEKLTIYMKTLGGPSNLSTSQNSTAQSPTSPSTSTALPEPMLQSFLVASLSHLNFLLQMTCLKRPVFNSSQSQPSPVTAKALQQDLIKLIGLVITIATHPVWASVLASLTDQQQQQDRIRETVEFAFDVAATLVDDMAEESRMFCVKILKDKLRHDRVRWLLGSVNTFGSAQCQDLGHGYQVAYENKGTVGEWKPKVWEMLETGGSAESGLGLGLFGARKA